MSNAVMPRKVLMEALRRTRLAVALSVGILSTCVLRGQVATIELSDSSAYGVFPSKTTGRVLGVSPAAFRVAPLIFVGGIGYFSKPVCSQTTVPINSDGTFEAEVATGGVDDLAERIALLVVPSSAQVPCYSAEPGIPEPLERLAVGKLEFLRPNPRARELTFARETWVVKSSRALLGPGQNYFGEDLPLVDGEGRLHLRLANRAGTWSGSEVLTRRGFGYGKYTFTTTVPPMAPNVVFGAFLWTDADRTTREIDMLECSRFLRAEERENCQYAVLPVSNAGLRRVSIPEGQPTDQTMIWEPGRVQFRSTRPDGTVIGEWSIAGAGVPRADSAETQVRFNLWLYNGTSPSDGREVEVVVHNFTFEPSSTLGPISQAVVHAASFQPAVAPGTLASVFGLRIANGTAAADSLPLPSVLGSVRVTINGLPAPIHFAAPNQVNIQVPYSTAPGLGMAVIRNDLGQSFATPLRVSPSAPGVFTWEGDRCVALDPAGLLNTPSNPAKRTGDVLVLYLSGVGLVDPQVRSGDSSPSQPLARPILPVRVTVGDRDVSIRFAGLTPGTAGVAQANVEIGPAIPPGEQPVVVRVGAAESRACKVFISGLQ